MPHPIKYQPTALQELAGACMIIGAVFFVPLCGPFGFIGFGCKMLKKLIPSDLMKQKKELEELKNEQTR